MLVALDLQKLVVTDGKASVFVYDLRLPALNQFALPASPELMRFNPNDGLI